MIPKTVQHTDSTKWKEEKIDFLEMITYFIFASSLFRNEQESCLVLYKTQ